MNEIYTIADTLAGTLTTAQTAILHKLCGTAYAELSARLKAGVTVASAGDAFSLAAAMLALSQFMLLGETEGINSFSAGDVSVSLRGTGSVRSGAKALRSQAELLMSGYLRDNGFCFLGVRG